MRCFNIAGRVIKQILKDRRTLALLFVAPVLVIFLLYIVLNSGGVKPRVQIFALPNDLQDAISAQADVSVTSDVSIALDDLKYSKTDAVITYDEPTITVYIEGSQTAVTASVKKAIASAVSEYSKNNLKKMQEQFQILQNSNKQGSNASAKVIDNSSIQIDIKYSLLCGSDDMTTFDGIAPLMMGFFIFFFVFLLAGVAFLNERISGTLERLLATPVRRYEIVLGYFLGFGIFVFLQTMIIQIYMVNILHIALVGNFLLVLFTNILLAAGSLSLGTLLSAFARSELQLFQFIPLVIVPQILFCGLFSLRGAPAWVIILSKVFPLTYAADALTNVALRGFGLSAILPDLLILLSYMILFLVLNTLVLKKYRKI